MSKYRRYKEWKQLRKCGNFVVAVENTKKVELDPMSSYKEVGGVCQRMVCEPLTLLRNPFLGDNSFIRPLSTELHENIRVKIITIQGIANCGRHD